MKNELPAIDSKIHDFGKKIAMIRKEKGLTQKELADKIGIERYLLSDYEVRRVRIYDEMLARIALALEVSADEILGLKKQSSRKKPPSLRLMKRLYEIEKLTSAEQKALLKNIDMFLMAAKAKR